MNDSIIYYSDVVSEDGSKYHDFRCLCAVTREISRDIIICSKVKLIQNITYFNILYDICTRRWCFYIFIIFLIAPNGVSSSRHSDALHILYSDRKLPPRVVNGGFTYQVVESSAHSFGIDPQLPLARVTVPRLAHMVPFEQLLRVINPVNGVSVDGQRVVGFVGLVLDPRIYDTGFTGICVHGNNKQTRIKKKKIPSVQ